MDEQNQQNSPLPGSSGSGQPDAQGTGAPVSWSAPDGYWGASSTADQGASPQSGDGTEHTLWDSDEWSANASNGPYAASANSQGDSTGNSPYAAGNGSYPGGAPRYPQGQQYPGQETPYQTGQGAPQPDWDAWYSSSFGGGYPGGPNGGYPGDPQGPYREPPRKNGFGRRVAALIAGLTLVLVAAAAVVIPAHDSGIGLWPSSSQSSTSQAAGSGQNGSSSGQGSADPGWSQGTSQQTTTDSRTNPTAAQDKGVVLIETTTTSGSAAGTGMILSSDGYVLTNYHVVESSTQIKATIASTGASYTATVVGHDETNDVALLKLSGATGLSTVTTDTDGVKLGDAVTAVGNSEGQGYLSAAAGAITSTSATVTVSSELSSSGSETLKDVYQTDAQAVPGDSGGPMYDSQNEVVGITTAGEQSNTSSGQTTTVSSWAIPISRALAIVDQIESGKDSGTVQVGPKAYLGVTVQASRGYGLTVTQVVSGGPADAAGLTVGDSIESINGAQVGTQSDLSDALAQLNPGDRATLTVMDASGGTDTVTVTLGSSPIN